MLTKRTSVLLNSVVRQVNESIVWVLWINGILGGTCPEVPLLTVVNFALRIHKHPNSNVKLSLLDEERPFNILLNYE